MKRLLIISCLLLPLLALAEDPSPGDLLVTAFERIDHDLENFHPYTFLYDVHTWVRDGDDELEEEYVERGRIKGFTPDSTMSEVIEEKKIFSKDEDDSKDEDESKHKGRPKEDGEEDEEAGAELPELDTEFREKHEFRFDEWTERQGKRVAKYKIRPKKNKKNEYWKGHVWFGSQKGELLALDLEPAKRPFGLKAMRIAAEYEPVGERDLPYLMDMDVEVKIPIIVHKKIRVEMRFTEFENLD
ncbi:hypothetical protein H8E52_09225 [bacterium]|nr:hypothetical protein [bacterium]